MTKIKNIQQKLLTSLINITILIANLGSFSQEVMAKKITTVVAECTIPTQLTAWNKTCTLPKFDKKLGTLLAAIIKGSINTETVWKIENRDAGGADFRLTVGATADFKDPVTGRNSNSLFATSINGVNISGIVSDQTLNKNLSPFDSNFDNNGAFGRTYDGTTPNTAEQNTIYPKIITSKTDSKILTDVDSLNFFAGNTGDTFITNIATKGRTVTDYDTTNFTQEIDTIAGASAEVVYEYEAPNVAISFDNLPIINLPGSDFFFNLQVQNLETTSTPSGVRATLTLPSGTTFNSTDFVFAGWTVSVTGSVVTFVRTNPMAASLTEKLPIKLTITNSAPNNIPLIAKVIIAETDYDLTNNDKTVNIPKNLAPILSTILPFSVVNNNIIFKLPTNILGAIDPNTPQEGDFVKSFVITKLNNPVNGDLFLDQFGTIPVILNQVLTTEQARNPHPKPKISFVGNISFEFTAFDSFEAKNPPISTNFNLTNPQNGANQYYGTGAISNNSNLQNTNNLSNNSQFYKINSTNSQNSNQTNQTNSATNNSTNNPQNLDNSNQTNQDQNYLKKLTFRLINGQLVNENSQKINLDSEILIEKNGEINKDKINQIIQNYLKKELQNNSNENKNQKNIDKLFQTQNIQDIYIEQNGKIINKIKQVKFLDTSQNFEIKIENSQNTQNEKNLVRTGAIENLELIGVGVLAILSAIGLLWTYFSKLGKGKNETKIELGSQILR